MKWATDLSSINKACFVRSSLLSQRPLLGNNRPLSRHWQHRQCSAREVERMQKTQSDKSTMLYHSVFPMTCIMAIHLALSRSFKYRKHVDFEWEKKGKQKSYLTLPNQSTKSWDKWEKLKMMSSFTQPHPWLKLKLFPPVELQNCHQMPKLLFSYNKSAWWSSLAGDVLGLLKKKKK